VIAGEELARSAEAALDLVDHEEDAVPARELRQRPHRVRGRRDETALTLLQLDHDGGHLARVHQPGEHPLPVARLRLTAARLAVRPSACCFGTPIAVREGRPIHLRRERPEALLVGHRLGRHGHGEIGAAVEGVLEADDGGPAGGIARHLDRVLDGLGAGVDEQGPLVVVARRDAVEPFGQRHVGLVGGDRKGRVGEPIELLTHRGHHVG